MDLCLAGRARQLWGVWHGQGDEQAQSAGGPCASPPLGASPRMSSGATPAPLRAEGSPPITYCKRNLSCMAGLSVLFLNFWFATCLA